MRCFHVCIVNVTSSTNFPLVNYFSARDFFHSTKLSFHNFSGNFPWNNIICSSVIFAMHVIICGGCGRGWKNSIFASDSGVMPTLMAVVIAIMLSLAEDTQASFHDDEATGVVM